MDQTNPSGKPPIITDQLIESITRVEELAYELKIQEVMTSPVKTLTPDRLMSDVLEMFRKERVSGAPVVENGVLVGVISIEDVIRCLINSDQTAPIAKYMSEKPITVSSSGPVVDALKLFVNSRKGRLPVLDNNNRLVGIITKGDITLGLLKALQRDYQVEELRKYRASHLFEDIASDRTSLILRYTIKPRDFNQGGSASSHIKRALLRLGADPRIARRCGIAVYEAEMNLIIHTTHGGAIRVEIEPHQISIEATDDGPGIKDVEMAMKAGYSTATEEIRELGFGAGMGLVNIARCVDTMKLESTWGKGSRLIMIIDLNKDGSLRENTQHPKEK